jgi:hypothetical protein
MKHLKLYLVVLVASFSLLTCERDDLCPETTPTTPSLIIDFYNNNAQDSRKNATNLYVIGQDNEDVLDGYNVETVNQVVLPLRTDTDTTTFALTRNTVLDDDGNITSGNTDTVTITYATEDVYVSRACGYKTIFKNVVVTIDGGTDANWIIFAQPENDNLTIEDETTTHYFFYH